MNFARCGEFSGVFIRCANLGGTTHHLSKCPSWFQIQPWIWAAPTPVWGVRVLGRAVEFLLLQINRAPPKIVPSPRVKLLLKHTPRTAPSSPLEIENRTSNWKPNWNWAWNWEVNVKQEQCPFGWWMQCTTLHHNAIRDTKSQNFPVGRISRAKTFRLECVNLFCNIYAPKVRKALSRHRCAKQT